MKVWLDDLSVAERWRLTDTDVKRALEIIGIRQAYMLGKWSEVFEA